MKIFRQLLKNKLSLLGLVLLLAFIFMAILAPFIAKPDANADPYQIPRRGWSVDPTPPSAEYRFGLSEGQYDIFYGCVWGTRTAFRVGLIVVGLSCLIGIVVGSLAGFYGGILDEVLMRVTDIFLSFPFLIAAVVITTILGKGLGNVMIAMVLFYWMGYARLIRGSILAVKQEEYVQAAKAIGVSNFKIVMRHILPNTIFPVIIQASMNLGSVVITASSLAFLGVGAPEGYVDWGQMISFSRNWMLGSNGNPLQYWYTVVYPGTFIVLFVLAWNLVGDAFRDILDPRMQN